MVKLTDSQRIVLSKAAAREDGAAVVPLRMTKAAAVKIGSSLIDRKLMRKIRSKAGMPVWCEGRPVYQPAHLAAAAPRPGSKQDLVVEMLPKQQGATLDALVKATVWLPDTTGAALTGLQEARLCGRRIRNETKGSLPDCEWSKRLIHGRVNRSSAAGISKWSLIA